MGESTLVRLRAGTNLGGVLMFTCCNVSVRDRLALLLDTEVIAGLSTLGHSERLSRREMADIFSVLAVAGSRAESSDGS